MIHFEDCIAIEWRNDNRRAVWLRDGWPDNAIKELDRYAVDMISVSAADFDHEDHWFALWVAYCFDPPITMINARSFEDAYDKFIDDHGERSGLRIDEASLSDYDEETLNYDSNGNAVDTEAVQGNSGWKISRVWTEAHK